MARSLTANYTTAPQLVVDGVKYTMYRVSLRAASALVMTKMVPFGETKADFVNVPAGTYHVRVELSSAVGLSIGPGFDSEAFVVPDDSVTLEVPIAVNVTVHPLA
jgi:hypothetical protein